jgi:hypothetical protein
MTDDNATLEAPQVVMIPAGHIFATWPAVEIEKTQAIMEALAGAHTEPYRQPSECPSGPQQERQLAELTGSNRSKPNHQTTSDAPTHRSRHTSQQADHSGLQASTNQSSHSPSRRALHPA